MPRDRHLRLNDELCAAVEPGAGVPAAPAKLACRAPHLNDVVAIRLQRVGNVAPDWKISVVRSADILSVDIHISHTKQPAKLKKHSLPRSPFPIPHFPRKRKALPIPHLAHRLEATCAVGVLLRPRLLELRVMRQVDGLPFAGRLVLAPLELPAVVHRQDNTSTGDRLFAFHVDRRRARRPRREHIAGKHTAKRRNGTKYN